MVVADDDDDDKAGKNISFRWGSGKKPVISDSFFYWFHFKETKTEEMIMNCNPPLLQFVKKCCVFQKETQSNPPVRPSVRATIDKPQPNQSIIRLEFEVSVTIRGNRCLCRLDFLTKLCDFNGEWGFVSIQRHFYTVSFDFNRLKSPACDTLRHCIKHKVIDIIYGFMKSPWYYFQKKNHKTLRNTLEIFH